MLVLLLFVLLYVSFVFVICYACIDVVLSLFTFILFTLVLLVALYCRLVLSILLLSVLFGTCGGVTVVYIVDIGVDTIATTSRWYIVVVPCILLCCDLYRCCLCRHSCVRCYCCC